MQWRYCKKGGTIVKKILKGTLIVLLVALAIVYAADHFEKNEETTKTEYYPDKGSYTYFYSPPEATTTESQSSGIYFYEK